MNNNSFFLIFLINEQEIMARFQSNKNYFFIFCLRKAYFSRRSKSSPRILYMMNNVAPTYQAKNIIP